MNVQATDPLLLAGVRKSEKLSTGTECTTPLS